jgi:hypothetical protein
MVRTGDIDLKFDEFTKQLVDLAEVKPDELDHDEEAADPTSAQQLGSASPS